MTRAQKYHLAAVRVSAWLALPPLHTVHIPPEVTMMKDDPLASTADDELGIAWWNHLTERERARWSREAGNTGRASDAWHAFKRSAQSLPAASRASHHS